MAEDALHSSEWDDVVSANPLRLPAAAGLELAGTLDDDDALEEAEEVSEPEAGNTTVTEADDTSEVPAEATPKKFRDTSGLLSTLTEGADAPFVEPVTSPRKDEALFRDIGNSLKITDTKEDKDDSIRYSSLGSPTKLRRHNVFRAPRQRRNPVKTDKSEDQDPLGPLGGFGDNELENETTESPADRLLKEADKPLFAINRALLSPLKKQAQETQPKQTIQSVTHDTSKVTPELALKMEISVGDPIKVGELTGAHIVYSVRTTCDSKPFTTPHTVVSRRYRDFRWLYKQLQSTHPGRIIPPPPDKQAVGRFNEDFIEGRRYALERMLVKIAQSPVLHNDPDFHMFLQSEKFTSEAREREKAAGATSVFTEHDSDSLNNSSGGFLSSIGGAFSFTPKIVEPDEFFKDRNSYIESLNQQYKIFLKNLETIIVQRHDLAAVTEEFAHIIVTLADLEISKSATDLFQEFSTTQIRIKELLDRVSLQDMLTLGATLDEYTRIISAIKTVFQQRDKMLVQLSVSDAELKKKQASLDKYAKYNRTQTDKIDVIKSELQALEQKHNTSKERFDTISKTIKSELEVFEVDKIHDFRNAIEIFLESTIESQKEAVELWETFYNHNLST